MRFGLICGGCVAGRKQDSRYFAHPKRCKMSNGKHVYSVSEVTFLLKDLVETTFPSVWLAGEISDFARPRSGHCYLTLKDQRCQIRAVIWKDTAARLRFAIEDGLQVVCHGHIDVYAPRGSYQLIIEDIQPRGVGALELAMRQLRKKLAAEGLFEAAAKKPLPRFARRIAVVTSPTGAAIRDFLKILRRRWRGVDVMIVPVRVQGEGSAREIAVAIADVNRISSAAATSGQVSPVDCIVVTRGGGSLEDLWAFNEEPVVRAVAASEIPVISAVGHEIDVTLADLAADVRAATPSEAAELVAPTSDELSVALGHLNRRLTAAVCNVAANSRRGLDAVATVRVFRRPHDLTADRARRLDELDARLSSSLRHRWSLARARLDAMAGRLESLSPLGVLARGYSVTKRLDDQSIVRRADQLTPSERIQTILASGTITSTVDKTTT